MLFPARTIDMGRYRLVTIEGHDWPPCRKVSERGNHQVLSWVRSEGDFGSPLKEKTRHVDIANGKCETNCLSRLGCSTLWLPIFYCCCTKREIALRASGAARKHPAAHASDTAETLLGPLTA